MTVERFRINISCSNCGNEATIHITENDGWSFASRGAESKISRIVGEVSINKTICTCKKCQHQWTDNYFVDVKTDL